MVSPQRDWSFHSHAAKRVLIMNLWECVNCGQHNDLGDCCYDCACRECDRCNKTIPFDEDISPHDVFGEDYFDKPGCSEFSDGAYNLCVDCMTPAEILAMNNSERRGEP